MVVLHFGQIVRGLPVIRSWERRFPVREFECLRFGTAIFQPVLLFSFCRPERVSFGEFSVASNFNPRSAFQQRLNCTKSTYFAAVFGIATAFQSLRLNRVSGGDNGIKLESNMWSTKPQPPRRPVLSFITRHPTLLLHTIVKRKKSLAKYADYHKFAD